MAISYLTKEQRETEEDILYSNIYKLAFNLKDFLGQWNEIDSTYKALGFLPYEDDKKKIEDYQYINDCFYNYVVGKQEDISNNINNIHTLKELVEKWTNARVAPKKEGWSPRFVVYVNLRNSWLSLMAEQIERLIEILEEE